MPLQFCHYLTKGGPCISNNSKHVNSSGENTVKITSNKANNGIEMNKNYSHDEMPKDLIINPHKEVILKEPTKTKDQVPMEEWSILTGQTIDFYHLYITHVLLFTLAVFLFRLALPLWVWLHIYHHIVFIMLVNS